MNLPRIFPVTFKENMYIYLYLQCIVEQLMFSYSVVNTFARWWNYLHPQGSGVSHSSLNLNKEQPGHFWRLKVASKHHQCTMEIIVEEKMCQHDISLFEQVGQRLIVCQFLRLRLIRWSCLLLSLFLCSCWGLAVEVGSLAREGLHFALDVILTQAFDPLFCFFSLSLFFFFFFW